MSSIVSQEPTPELSEVDALSLDLERARRALLHQVGGADPSRKAQRQDLEREVDRLRAELKGREVQLEEREAALQAREAEHEVLRNECERLRGHIEVLHASPTWRLGRLLTALPRRLRDRRAR